MSIRVLKRWCVVLIFISTNVKAAAYTKDTLLIHQLVKEIAAMQYQSEASFGFHPGMFYSYKKWAGYPHRYSPDNNIFYTGIIAFALQNMLPQLSEPNRQICKSIIDKTAKAYPYYKNKKGLPSYFFWQDGKPIMPHTLFVHKLSDLIATSEDVDDSVMLLMAMNAPDSSTYKLHRVMDTVANTQLRTITNTYKKYKKLPAHTTYLGKKMRVDFDLAVHCNVLYFLLEENLPFNRFDSATLQIATQMIKNREYVSDPKFIAPYYISTPVILYHIARLMGKFEIPALLPYKQQLIEDIKAELNHATNIMEQVILGTSLKRLGAQPEPLLIGDLVEFNQSNQSQFVFYQARAASQMPNPFKRLLLNFSMLNYHFFCPAYNKVLLLEYLTASPLNPPKGDFRTRSLD